MSTTGARISPLLRNQHITDPLLLVFFHKTKKALVVTLALDHFLRVIALPALRNDMTHHGSDDEGTEMINEVSLERFLWSPLLDYVTHSSLLPYKSHITVAVD